MPLCFPCFFIRLPCCLKQNLPQQQKIGLLLVEKDEFYYIDNIQNNEVWKLKDRDDWDGKYILERVEFSHSPESEPEVIFEYKDSRDLWKNLKIHGLSLKEVIERSVVMVMH